MNTATSTLPNPLALNIELTDEQFWQICQKNRDLKFERTTSGDLLIMPPTGGNTGKRNIKIATQLEIWSSQTKLGDVFDSSTCFKLPNGANRSPDAAWIHRQRWDALTPEQQEQFPPLCPDFVVELLSPSDSPKKIQEKMQEYIENGASLGWLIDPKNRRVEIYRSNQDVEILENPATLSGEEILPDFILSLAEIF